MEVEKAVQAKTPFDTLASILDELVVLYRNLFDHLQKEKSYLIAADLAQLRESNKTKEALLYKIRGVDRSRDKSAKDLALTLNMDPAQARLLLLAEKLPAAQATTLRERHKILSMQIERVVELNQDNERFTQSALTALNGAMDEIKQIVSVKPTYGKKGTMAGSSETNAGNFVSKEA